jgi:hypothetical protein
MLKEEIALREWANDGTIPRRRKIGKLITALVRAVREDCARVAKDTLGGAPITDIVVERIRRAR